MKSPSIKFHSPVLPTVSTGTDNDPITETSREAPAPDAGSGSNSPRRHVHAERARVLGSTSIKSPLPLPSADDVRRIIEDARHQETGEVDLATELEKKGFQKTLSELHLSDQGALSLKGVNLNGIAFHRCTFEWSHLSESDLTDCRFSDCTFRNTAFTNSRMHKCTFTHCDFDEAMFLNSTLSAVKFLHSTLTNTSFEDARISASGFEDVEMPGTHFLSAAISQTQIRQSNLTDTIFFDKKTTFDIDDNSLATAKLTKPTTATLVSSETRGVSVPLVGEKIVDVAATTPVRVAMQTPAVSKEDVDREVEAILQSFNTLPLSADERTIPQRLLRTINEHPDKYPNAFALLEKTRVLFQHVHSVVLPGGEDVSPMLYGEENHGSIWNGDYRRSLMELGLIDQSIRKGMPFMSICRGFQMLCVYLGVKLNQDIGKEQVGVRVLKDEADVGGNASGTEVFGIQLEGKRVAVYHHQLAPDQELPHITGKLTRTIKGIKAIMVVAKEGGAPLIAFQFHPEFFKERADMPPDLGLSNEDLIRLANEYVRPGTNQPGLRTPSDMKKSGILGLLSPENDKPWEVIGNAAKVRSITSEELIEAKSHLHKPADRNEHSRKRASTLTPSVEVAPDESQRPSKRKRS